MVGGDLLVIEKEDGTYMASLVGMMWMTLLLQIPNEKGITDNAKRLYESFGDGTDKNEFVLDSLENLRENPKCKADVHIIIPKTKDRFLRVEAFLKGDFTDQISKSLEERKAKGLA